MDKNGDMLEYRHLMKRPEYVKVQSHAYGEKTSRLSQGMKGRVEGTGTMHFIHKHEVPRDRNKDVTYGKINCNYQEGKEEPNECD